MSDFEALTGAYKKEERCAAVNIPMKGGKPQELLLRFVTATGPATFSSNPATRTAVSSIDIN